MLPPPPPPVIHNFRNKASIEHVNEYHIKRKLCITGEEQQQKIPKSKVTPKNFDNTTITGRLKTVSGQLE